MSRPGESAQFQTLALPMNPPNDRSFVVRIQLRLAAARFLTFSALLHIIVVVSAGSVVLVRQATQPPDFQSPDVGGLVENDPAPHAPNDPIEPQTETFTPPAPAAPSAAINTITTTQTSSAAFPIPNSPSFRAASFDSAQGAGAGAIKGISDKLGQLGKGMSGGKITSFFGMPKIEVPALAGTFYDLKQTRSRRPTDMTPDQYGETVLRFLRDGWRESILDDFFHSSKPLHAAQIMIPNMPADAGPKAFGLENRVQPSRWLVHYKARVSPPRPGTFHFVGGGDDVLCVRFNGRLVLERNWSTHSGWKSERNYDFGFSSIPNGFAKGDAIRVLEGEWYEVEILIGEQPGGLVFACLLMEEDGAEYERDARGNPILPVFRVAEVAMPELGKGQTLPPFQADGPVWKAASLKAESQSGLEMLRAGK